MEALETGALQERKFSEEFGSINELPNSAN